VGHTECRKEFFRAQNREDLFLWAAALDSFWLRFLLYHLTYVLLQRWHYQPLNLNRLQFAVASTLHAMLDLRGKAAKSPWPPSNTSRRDALQAEGLRLHIP
jgi:hypothetical protein